MRALEIVKAVILLVCLTFSSSAEDSPSVSIAIQGSKLPADHPFALCATCHGDVGEGNKELMAPRLMGQHMAYLKNQMKAFKNGWRGKDPEHAQGLMMSNAVAGLSEGQIDAALKYLSEVNERQPSHRIFGDRWRGEHLYQRGCAICHGEEGEGSTQYHMAKLNMQHGWYLEKQLNRFRSGKRGVHTKDESGKTMAFYAKLLPDDESVTDVVAYLTYLARLKYREKETAID